MEISRRRFNGHLVKGVLALALVPPAFMISGCAAGADLEKVLALLPTVEEIGNTILDVIATLDPGIGTIIKVAVTGIEAGFTDVQAIITAYKNNIAGMPPTIVNKLDAAIAAISSQITTIESQFPQIPSIVQIGISIGLGALKALLGFLAGILPNPIVAQMFPKSFALLSARGIQFGVQTVVIPSRRQFAKDYNAKMDHAGYKKAHIHVPWIGHVIP